MATKFKIKKVNPSVPTFTRYVACPSTCENAYILPSDCIGTDPGECPECPECPEPEPCIDCIEQGYYSECNTCCPDPLENGYYLNCDECCPEPQPTKNYTLVNFTNPVYFGSSVPMTNWEVDGREFYNLYILPYLEQIEGNDETNFRILWSYGKPFMNNPFTEEGLEFYDGSDPSIDFGVPYFGIYSGDFNKPTMDSAGFNTIFRATGHMSGGDISIIFQADNGNFIILSNILRVT